MISQYWNFYFYKTSSKALVIGAYTICGFYCWALNLQIGESGHNVRSNVRWGRGRDRGGRAVVDAMLPVKPKAHCRSHQLMSDVVGVVDRQLVVLVADGRVR